VEPDAWAVWSAWQGTKDVLVGIASAVGDQLEGSCALKICVEGSVDEFPSPQRFVTDAPDRYLKKFSWIRLERRSPTVRVELDFVRQPTDALPNSGVALRVWALTEAAKGEAVAVRDELRLAVERGHTFLTRTTISDGRSTFKDAREEVEGRRSILLLFLAEGVLFGGIIAAVRLHRYIEKLAIGTTAKRALALIIWCGCRHPIFFDISLITAAIVLMICVFVFFPAVEIAARSVYARLGLKAIALGGGGSLATGLVNVAYRHVF
jgi:hypothetical protein